MPATDRVLQVGNANFASPVPAASKFSKPQKSAWAKLSPPTAVDQFAAPPVDQFATPPEPTRVASAPLTGSRRVANFCATPQEPSRRRRPASRRRASRRPAPPRTAVRRLARRPTPRARSPRSPRRNWRRCHAAPGAGGVISGVEVVSHLDEKPFAIYLLAAPLLSGEHVAFRRYSEFVRLDRTLRAAWAAGTPCALLKARASCPRCRRRRPSGRTRRARRSPRTVGRAAALARRRPRPPVARRYNEKAWDAFRQFLGVPW